MIEITLTGEAIPFEDGEAIIIGAENRVTPRYKTTVWHESSDQREKALPAGMVPPPPGSWVSVWEQLLVDASGLIDELAAEKIGARAFIDDFAKLLEGAHARSWYLGRYLAGDTREMDLADLLVGRASADMDGYYLQGFLKAIENGEYGGIDSEWNVSAIRNRAQLYANKTRGTANEAFVAASAPELEFYWTLGAAEHCPDCLDFHALNPWLGDEVHTNPGDGQTLCITNCKCVWVRSDGVRGFPPAH